jgi:hypothetical protein
MVTILPSSNVRLDGMSSGLSGGFGGGGSGAIASISGGGGGYIGGQQAGTAYYGGSGGTCYVKTDHSSYVTGSISTVTTNVNPSPTAYKVNFLNNSGDNGYIIITVVP